MQEYAILSDTTKDQPGHTLTFTRLIYTWQHQHIDPVDNEEYSLCLFSLRATTLNIVHCPSQRSRSKSSHVLPCRIFSLCTAPNRPYIYIYFFSKRLQGHGNFCTNSARAVRGGVGATAMCIENKHKKYISRSRVHFHHISP